MATRIEELIPDYLRGLPVYVPGKPIEEVERELKIHAVKLASNENPLGPSPNAVEAARAVFGDSNRYPDGGTYYLRQKLAAMHGVSSDEIFVSLGSSELIDLAARVLLRSGLQGITSIGTYAPFSIAIRASGAELVLVPQQDFAFDLSAIAKAITPKTGVIYLANPNNPTGTAFTGNALREFVAGVPDGVLVVLDEAYIHYATSIGLGHSVEAYRKRKNLLILRTFSKVYGLAGLRIGYAIGQPELLAAMNKLKTPFNTSGVAQAAALAALDDKEHVTRCIETNAAERKRLTEGMRKLGLRPVESEANFVFVSVGPEAKAICEELLHLGVIVRPLGWMGLPEAIRVSVGTADENGKYLLAMTQVLSKRAEKRELATR
ncbi:MAG TPA: histidinol-phosphate transaminase [Candidatus Dormibacteraeota bacterium]|nr:histidinol-phosphate transaminase [Candidatus Dormibacteraeota bacterium]